MRKYICFYMIFAVHSYVFSNDSRTILGSSVEILDNKNTNVSMLEEEINITLHADYYEVLVTFDFYNSGGDETVLLGFPVKTVLQNHPGNREWAQLQDFKSYINGDLLSEYTIREESAPSGHFYTETTTWYLREVLFPEKSHIYSMVTYKSPYNHFGFAKQAGYIYGTGKNWKDAIGKMIVYINHGDNILMDIYGNIAKTELFEFTWEASGRYKFVAENMEPENYEQAISISIKPFDLFGDYHNEFGSFSDGWIWNEFLIYKDENDIQLYTKNQIRLFINFFYAYHGYDFKDQFYKNYFENLETFYDYDSVKYRINKNFSENDFNEFERKNLNYLLNLEKKMPFVNEELSVFTDNGKNNQTYHGIWKYGGIIIIVITGFFVIKRKFTKKTK